MSVSQMETGTRTKKSISVWDPLVRIFHWTLAASVIFNLLNEEEGRAHELAGYVVIGLLVFRLFWGLAGPEHARFRNFVTGPAAVIDYLKSLLTHSPRHYLGHNPAGGWMVILMLAWLAVTAITGSLLAVGYFPGVGLVEEIHEAFAESLPVIIVIHLAGVLVSGLLHRENLVRAMITGKKPARD